MDEEERGRWWRGHCTTTSSAARQANNKQTKKTKCEEQQQKKTPNEKWLKRKWQQKNRVFHEIYQLTKGVCQKDQTRWYQTHTHTHTQSNVCMCVWVCEELLLAIHILRYNLHCRLLYCSSTCMRAHTHMHKHTPTHTQRARKKEREGCGVHVGCVRHVIKAIQSKMQTKNWIRKTQKQTTHWGILYTVCAINLPYIVCVYMYIYIHMLNVCA